jgi:hypothetical protein
LIKSHAKHTRETKFTYAITKAAINRQKTLFTGKLYLNLIQQLEKCYNWRIALHGAESCTARKVDQKYLESFEIWCWRRMKKISWTDRVKNEILRRIKA